MRVSAGPAAPAGEAPVMVAAPALTTFIAEALGAMGMAPARAALTADLMVRTDLRGVDSHGIGMLPRYVQLWQEGFLHPGAEPVVVRDDQATGLLDGGRGCGHPVSVEAMTLAIAKARRYGMGVVAVRNSGHYGAAANYSMMALAHDLIGISTTNTPYTAMVPTFGRTAMLGTNPLSFAAPAGRHAPFVLDMATTTVAVGKLTVAARWKKPIPAGWALDDRGAPTEDPVTALAHRLLSPLGGSRDLGGHKGYGLGVMVDILCGPLGGAVYGNLFQRTDMGSRRLQNVGHCFMAIDPARFRPLEEFKGDMDDLFESLRSSPRADSHERIYIAGEIEAECEARRRREGIPLAPSLAAQCEAIARTLGIRGLG